MLKLKLPSCGFEDTLKISVAVNVWFGCRITPSPLHVKTPIVGAAYALSGCVGAVPVLVMVTCRVTCWVGCKVPQLMWEGET